MFFLKSFTLQGDQAVLLSVALLLSSVPLKARPPRGPLYTLPQVIFGCDTKMR